MEFISIGAAVWERLAFVLLTGGCLENWFAKTRMGEEEKKFFFAH